MPLLKIVNSLILVRHCNKECVDMGMQVLKSACNKDARRVNQILIFIVYLYVCVCVQYYGNKRSCTMVTLA